MGWARYAHSMRVFVFNSGLFYLRPTQATMDLLDMIVYRVEHENGWDQAIFNEVCIPALGHGACLSCIAVGTCSGKSLGHALVVARCLQAIFFPSRPDHKDPSVTRRVMDYLLFMNSKVLFRRVRHDNFFKDHKPVSIHVNYHPDKFPRMLAIVDRYVNGNPKALEPFPDGSE